MLSPLLVLSRPTFLSPRSWCRSLRDVYRSTIKAVSLQPTSTWSRRVPASTHLTGRLFGPSTYSSNMSTRNRRVLRRSTFCMHNMIISESCQNYAWKAIKSSRITGGSNNSLDQRSTLRPHIYHIPISVSPGWLPGQYHILAHARQDRRHPVWMRHIPVPGPCSSCAKNRRRYEVQPAQRQIAQLHLGDPRKGS